jgi:hypothetical protein
MPIPALRCYLPRSALAEDHRCPYARLLEPQENLAAERAERTSSIVRAERIVTALGTTLAEMFAELEVCYYAASPVRPRLVPFPLDDQHVRVPPGEEDPQEPRFACLYLSPYPVGVSLRQ